MADELSVSTMADELSVSTMADELSVSTMADELSVFCEHHPCIHSGNSYFPGLSLGFPLSLLIFYAFLYYLKV